MFHCLTNSMKVIILWCKIPNAQNSNNVFWNKLVSFFITISAFLSNTWKSLDCSRHIRFWEKQYCYLCVNYYFGLNGIVLHLKMSKILADIWWLLQAVKEVNNIVSKSWAIAPMSHRRHLPFPTEIVKRIDFYKNKNLKLR